MQGKDLRFQIRKRYSLIVAVVAVCLLFATMSVANEKKIMTLNDCIIAAMDHNPNLRSKDLTLDVAKYERDIAQAPFDPILSFNIANSVARTGGISFESQISGGSETKIFGGDFEISQQLFSGDRWSLKFETSRSESQSFLTESYPTVYQGKTTLSYTYPLLEGSDDRVNKAQLEYASFSYAMNWYSCSEIARQLEYQTKSAFYDILKSRENIKVAEISLKTANNLYESTKARFEAGYVSSYEVMAAESGLASREEALLLAKTSLANYEDSLKTIMGFNLTEEIDFIGDFDIEIKEIESFDESLAEALASRPDLTQLDVQIRMAEYNLYIAKHRQKNNLALVGQLGVQGEDTELSGAIGDMNNLSWYLGLNYSMPLGGNREAKFTMKKTESELQSLLLLKEGKVQEITLEITQAIRNLHTVIERIKVTKKGVELQEEKLKQENARFEIGLITAGDLLDFEEDLAMAQLRLIEAKADYLKALANLGYVMGEY